MRKGCLSHRRPEKVQAGLCCSQTCRGDIEVASCKKSYVGFARPFEEYKLKNAKGPFLMGQFTIRIPNAYTSSNWVKLAGGKFHSISDLIIIV